GITNTSRKRERGTAAATLARRAPPHRRPLSREGRGGKDFSRGGQRRRARGRFLTPKPRVSRLTPSRREATPALLPVAIPKSAGGRPGQSARRSGARQRENCCHSPRRLSRFSCGVL